MGNEDYNRQVKWLMDEIKHSCAKNRKRQMAWNAFFLIVFIAIITLNYLRDGDSSCLVADAALICPLLFLFLLSFIRHKRIERAVSAEELISVFKQKQAWAWVSIVAFCVWYWLVSSDILVIKVFSLGVWVLLLVIAMLNNHSGSVLYDDDEDGYFERLQELVKNGE